MPAKKGKEYSEEEYHMIKRENRSLRKTCHFPVRATDAGIYFALGRSAEAVQSGIQEHLRKSIQSDLESMNAEEEEKFRKKLAGEKKKLFALHQKAKIEKLHSLEDSAVKMEESNEKTAQLLEMYKKEHEIVAARRQELIKLNSNVRAYALVKRNSADSSFQFSDNQVVMSEYSEFPGPKFLLDGISYASAIGGGFFSLISDYTKLLSQGQSFTLLHFGHSHSGKYKAFREAIKPASGVSAGDYNGTFDFSLQSIFSECLKGRFSFEATVVEVYNEKLFDVQSLRISGKEAPVSNAKVTTERKATKDSSKGAKSTKSVISGLTWTVVGGLEDCKRLMAECDKKRKEIWADSEAHFRLSHLLFSLKVSSDSFVHDHFFNIGVVAGSEDHFVLSEVDPPATKIVILREVLKSMAFSSVSPSAVSKSKLTGYLAPSLRNRGKVLLVVHLLTDKGHSDEMKKTLQFATDCMDKELTRLLNEATGGRFSLTGKRNVGLNATRRMSVSSAIMQKSGQMRAKPKRLYASSMIPRRSTFK